jgi:hypothetical protein
MSACRDMFHRCEISQMYMLTLTSLVERTVFILIHVSLRISDLGIQNLGSCIKNFVFEFGPIMIFCELIFD